PAMQQWRVSPRGQRHSIQPHRPPRPMTHTLCSSYPLLFLYQQGSVIISNVSKTYSLLYCGHVDGFAALDTSFAHHTYRLYLDARGGGRFCRDGTHIGAGQDSTVLCEGSSSGFRRQGVDGP